MGRHPKKEDKQLYKGHMKDGKGFDVFMRNQNKMYVNSFNVIDRKAAIMIRVNAAIISAVVIFFDSVKDLKCGHFIGVIMILSSFSSLIFALNASRPKTFRLFQRMRDSTSHKYTKLEEHIFGVGLTHNVSLEEYERAFDQILQNQEYQIGNQVRTIYLFEKFINKSFRQIELSYVIFMVGFIIIVITFLAENVVNFV